MLVEDEVGSRTIHLSREAEDLSFLGGCADLVICRNAVDHMPKPGLALQEMWEILQLLWLPSHQQLFPPVPQEFAHVAAFSSTRDRVEARRLSLRPIRHCA